MTPAKTADADLADLLEASPKKQQLQNQQRQETPGVCQIVWAHLCYYLTICPSLCGCIGCLGFLLVILCAIGFFVNPTQYFGEAFKNDWTSVKSKFELDVGKIDHWCLGGGNEGCKCEDPMVPTSRVELRSWTEAYKANKKQIERYVEDPVMMADLDVAIIGESAVEEMDGRWMGRRPNDELVTIGTIFRNHFHREKGASVEAVALGIAGDSANNVLWRLLHGEMPDSFNPKIWWVHIGQNDLTRQQCSEEVVVLGVLRVVEEILTKRPDARVVINSLLPMADLRGGGAIKEQDYRDAFDTYGGRRGRGSTARYVHRTINGVERIVPADSINKKSSSDDKRKRTVGSSHQQGHHHRQLLEQALEDFSPRHNDNSDFIDYLHDELELDMAELMMEFEEGDSEAAHNRRLERLEPREPRNEGGKQHARRAKDTYNPTINKEKHRQKKYNFFRKRRMPLWTSIFAINKQIFKFCEKHERVDFFDATNIFAERRKHDDGGSQKFFTLMSDMISARGHPTEVGFLKWEDAMVVKIEEVLGEMKRDSPHLFTTSIKGVDVPGNNGVTDMDRLEKKSLIDDNRGGEMTTGISDGDADESVSRDKMDESDEGEGAKTSGAHADGIGDADAGGEDVEPPTDAAAAGGGGAPPESEGDDDEEPKDEGDSEATQQAAMQQGMGQSGYGQQQQPQGGYQQQSYQQQQPPQGGYQQQPYQQQPYQQQPYQQRPQTGNQEGYQEQPYQQRQPPQGSYQQQQPPEGGYQQQPYQQPPQGGYSYQQQPYKQQSSESGNRGDYQQQQQPQSDYQQQPPQGDYQQQQPYKQQQSQSGGLGSYEQESQTGSLGSYQQQPQTGNVGGYQQQPQTGSFGGYQQQPQTGGLGGYQRQPESAQPQRGSGNLDGFQAQPGLQQDGYNRGQTFGGTEVQDGPAEPEDEGEIAADSESNTSGDDADGEAENVAAPIDAQEGDNDDAV